MDPTVGLAIFGFACAFIIGISIVYVFIIGMREVSGYRSF